MSTPLDLDLVILDPAKDYYLCFDEIGRRVWDLLAVPVAAECLCGQVVMEYRGDAREIKADIMAFLDELAREGYVHVANG